MMPPVMPEQKGKAKKKKGAEYFCP